MDFNYSVVRDLTQPPCRDNTTYTASLLMLKAMPTENATAFFARHRSHIAMSVACDFYKYHRTGDDAAWPKIFDVWHEAHYVGRVEVDRELEPRFFVTRTL